MRWSEKISESLFRLGARLFRKKPASKPNREADGADEPAAMPLIGHYSIKIQYGLLGAVVLGASIAAASISSSSLYRVEQLTARVEHSVEIQMLTQRLSKDIQQAQSGDLRAASLVEQHRKQLGDLLKVYASGDSDRQAFEPQLQDSFIKPMVASWISAELSMNTLQKAQADIAKLSDNADDMNDRAARYKSSLEVAAILMTQRGEYEGRLSAVQSLGSAFNSLSRNMTMASRSSKIDWRTAFALNAGASEVKSLLGALIKGSPDFNFGPTTDPEVLTVLTQVELDSAEYLENVAAAARAGKTLSEGKAAANAAMPPLDALFSKAGELRKMSSDEFSSHENTRLTSRILFFVAALFLILLAVANSRHAARRTWAANKERQDTDNAVIELIYGLTPVSGGDLTSRLKVTEHVTGSIADSINATLEQLQGALQSVKDVSQETGALVGEIGSLSAQTQLTVDEASAVARESHDLSEQGANIVGRAVVKMDSVRGMIQDVSKRLKRLGEVSQAIGRVTGIIENVTEKTAILAMNTSLKAEESGEAGKPFRVIADEIRKLSDSTMKSLDEIADAVKAIQSETQTVIKTVETMTTDVVDGSRLWDEANVALKLITAASVNIEKLVGTVHGYSTQQTQATEAANGLMDTLQAKADEFVTQK